MILQLMECARKCENSEKVFFECEFVYPQKHNHNPVIVHTYTPEYFPTSDLDVVFRGQGLRDLVIIEDKLYLLVNCEDRKYKHQPNSIRCFYIEQEFYFSFVHILKITKPKSIGQC